MNDPNKFIINQAKVPCKVNCDLCLNGVFITNNGLIILEFTRIVIRLVFLS